MGKMTRRAALKAAALTAPTAAMAGAAAQAKKYLILSCDGGGMRGLLTAKIIERLNKEVPFLNQVDLFAGTSTGGIIALGLANGVTPSELVELYRDNGAAIFDREAPKPELTGKLRQLHDALRDRILPVLAALQINPRDLLHPKYPSGGLARVLTRFFGTTNLGHVKSGKSVLVTTLQLFANTEEWKPLVFHNISGDKDPTDVKVEDGPTPSTTLVDAAMSTSAAPLYFPPHDVDGFGFCVDGGMFANCPASIALALALRAGKADINDIAILSIGTGVQKSGIDIPNSSPFDKPEEYGALAWLSPISRGKENDDKDRLTPAFPLLSALFDASSAAHNYICKHALRNGDRYRRVQVTLPKPVALDDVRKDSLTFLEDMAAKVPEKDWDDTVKWLKARLA